MLADYTRYPDLDDLKLKFSVGNVRNQGICTRKSTYRTFLQLMKSSPVGGSVSVYSARREAGAPAARKIKVCKDLRGPTKTRITATTERLSGKREKRPASSTLAVQGCVWVIRSDSLMDISEPLRAGMSSLLVIALLVAVMADCLCLRLLFIMLMYSSRSPFVDLINQSLISDKFLFN